jgi:hypothetical protein
LDNLGVEGYKIIILPLVLYGYETWSLLLREVHRLKLFENRVMRIGPKRDEIRGLLNEELQNLCSSPNIIGMIKSKRMRWADHVTRMGEKKNALKP